jgi:hypothetical protein
MRALLLFVSAFLAAQTLAIWPDGPRLISVAYAGDDDGGGGDDDDDGGGRRGGWGNDDDSASPFNPRPNRNLRRQRPRTQRPAPPSPVVVQDEIVVVQVSSADVDRLAADGFAAIARAPLSSFGGEIARLTAPGGLDIAAARERIRLIAPAAIVDENHLYRPVEMRCRNDDCPAFEMIGWAVPPGTCSLEPTIGMIDTLVNTEHEALREQAIEVVTVLAEGDRTSAAVHGTAIAALLVGDETSRTPGLLPNASLVAVEAFHRDGSGDAADVFKVVRGLDALDERGVRVVNLSFAGPPNAVLEQAVRQAGKGEAILVAAAGNTGPAAAPAYPGAYPGVIAVTAVDRNRRVYRQAGRGDHIAFAAPGVQIWTAASISGGRFRSGTSYAVPFVSATIAALLARDAGKTPADILDALAGQSDDLGEVGRDPVFGWGLVKAGFC